MAPERAVPPRSLHGRSLLGRSLLGRSLFGTSLRGEAPTASRTGAAPRGGAGPGATTGAGPCTGVEAGGPGRAHGRRRRTGPLRPSGRRHPPGHRRQDQRRRRRSGLRQQAPGTRFGPARGQSDGRRPRRPMVKLLEAKAALAGVKDIVGVVCDLEELDFVPGSIDIVVSDGAMHELNDAEHEELIRSALRWLRPGGQLVIGEVEADPVRAERWERYFRRAGFTDISRHVSPASTAVMAGTKPPLMRRPSIEPRTAS